MKKKFSLIVAMAFLLSSCSSGMVKVNQDEIAKNEAELEEKNKSNDDESIENDNSSEKDTKDDKKDNLENKINKKIKLGGDSDKESDKKVENENSPKNTNKEIKRTYPENKNSKDSKSLSPVQNSNNNSTSSGKKAYVSFKNPDTSDKSKNYPHILKDLKGKEFVFSSGAGGWQTVLNFSENGNFTAKYEDYDYDSVSICEFNGKFSIDSRVNDTAYILRLDKAEITSPVNTEEVKNIDGKEMKVKYTDLPYGFAVNNDDDHSFQGKFSLYLPLRKRSQMSDKVNEWLDISGEKNVEKNITRIYLLVNNKTIDTFREQVK